MLAIRCQTPSLGGWCLNSRKEVPRLILINGLPGSGKSALGRRYLVDHQLALAIDIDVIGSMLGRSLEEPTMSGLAARDLARAMARTHLQAGHDVLVGQFLGRLEFVEVLDQLAATTRVPFVEVERPPASTRPRNVSCGALRTPVQSTVTRPSFSIALKDRTHETRCTLAWRMSFVPARRPAESRSSTETSRRPTRASFGKSTVDDRPDRHPCAVALELAYRAIDLPWRSPTLA